METSDSQKIFSRSNLTYYYSSLFFRDKTQREAITNLYAFVRTADNYVDQHSPDESGFDSFVAQYEAKDDSDPIIRDFITIENAYDFPKDWTISFLESMQSDFTKKTYTTLDELLRYMYGSAEVIGLYMARILGLSDKAYPFAKMQGRAMQYINFLRDIKEDLTLGRTYLPKEILDVYQISSLSEEEVKKNTNSFFSMIKDEVKRYREWQLQANEGFGFIPKKLLIPIKTAADMYSWAANEIEKNPMVVYEKKVKPGRNFVLFTALKNTLTL